MTDHRPPEQVARIRAAAARAVTAATGSSTLDLTGLDLRTSDVAALPLPARGVTRLVLRRNRLVWLPGAIRRMTDLTELEVDGNPLRALPDWIGGLTNLTTLEVGDTELIGLPDPMRRLTRLRRLGLGELGRPLLRKEYFGEDVEEDDEDLGEDGEDVGEDDEPRDYRSYDNDPQVYDAADLEDVEYPYGYAAVELPDWLGDLTRLTSLDLHTNRLRALPEWLRRLEDLRTLHLGHNALEELPGWLGGLHRLTALNLSDNRLTALPAQLSRLTALTTLNLGANRLAAVPDWISALAGLESLELRDNALRAVPRSVMTLPALRRLGLARNRITALPDGVALPALEDLDLRRNRLPALPRGLGAPPALRTVRVEGNPLPPELVATDHAEDTGAVAATLRRVWADGVEIAEAKLVLFGPRAADTDALLAALRGRPPVERRERAPRLRVTPVEIEHGGRRITLRAQDFGGQQRGGQTHPLFLAAPAVYLVVWDPQEGPGQQLVERWTAMLAERARGDACVLAVALGGRQFGPRPLDERALRTRFGALFAGVHEVDPARLKTVHRLRAALAEAALRFPHTVRWFPAAWRHAVEEISGSGAGALTVAGYRDAAARCELAPDEARRVAHAAHGWGRWIHHDDDPALAPFVVLDPEWLSAAVTRVLTDPDAIGSGGIVTDRHLHEIWSAHAPAEPRPGRPSTADEQRLLLAITERFGLAHPVLQFGGGEPRHVVGQLLPPHRPNLSYAWTTFRTRDPTVTRSCRIVRRDGGGPVVRDELVPRLVAHLHRRLLGPDRARHGAHWRGGLLVGHRHGARALITRVDDGVRVEARGPDADLVAWQLVEEIHECVEASWSDLTTHAS